jgi:hypothetical protein
VKEKKNEILTGHCVTFRMTGREKRREPHLISPWEGEEKMCFAKYDPI